MKKKIIAITLMALLVVPTAAYAKTHEATSKASKKVVTSLSKAGKGDKDNKQNKGQEKKDENKQKQQDKKTQKAAIKAKLATIKADLKKVDTLKKQINGKRAQLNTILEEINEGTKTLPADQLQALTSQANTLNTSYKNITKGLSSLYGQAEKKSKGKDVSSDISALDAIIATIEDKSSKLTDLSVQYDAALAIANTATDVTTPADTSTTPTDTTSSADDTSNQTGSTTTSPTDTSTSADTSTTVTP